MNPEQIEQDVINRVIKVIRSISSIDANAVIGVDADLFATEILDSILLVSLLDKIEHEFTIVITPDEFLPENFSTVANLAKAIIRIKSNPPK